MTDRIQSDSIADLSLLMSEHAKSDDEDTTGKVSVKVATLNALVKDKASRSLASFPTITNATIKKKQMGWLRHTLDNLFDLGIDIIAVQESCAIDATDSKYDCSISWQENGGDMQHLCFNPATIAKTTENNCGPDKAGIKSCKFTILKGSSRPQITVMAAHASPSFAEAVGLIDIASNPPDVILMDANQDGQAALAALAALPSKYSVYPPEASVVTTIKSAFKYRKLYQAFEGTCAISRKCTADEQGFHNLPAKWNTCGKLLESGECGDMSSKASEIMKQKEMPNVCKYASRVCGSYEEDYKAERELFMASQRKIKPDPFFLQNFDLTQIRSLLWGNGPTAADTDVKEKQEDVILFKSKYQKVFGFVFPGATNAKFLEAAEEGGFPNEYWPSDHFLIAAQLLI
jgi:hypothetical protein